MKKRESLGLSQEELAMKLSEKVSLLHKIETGHVEPSFKTAAKIEKLLKVKILEKISHEPEAKKSGKNAPFTLGDFIKVK